MLRMVNKVMFFLGVSAMVLAGNQEVDIKLNLTFQGASQKIIGDKMVIDLGYLEEGGLYKNIEIGTVDVRISQTKTSASEDACFLNNLEFNSVKIASLEQFSERIASSDKVYIGAQNNRIILTAREVKITAMEGNIDKSNEEFFFVAPECVGDPGFQGDALTSLSYTFKLYAEIEGEIRKESIVGTFAQESTGIETSIRSLITHQIKSNLKPYKRRK